MTARRGLGGCGVEWVVGVVVVVIVIAVTRLEIQLSRLRQRVEELERRQGPSTQGPLS